MTTIKREGLKEMLKNRYNEIWRKINDEIDEEIDKEMENDKTLKKLRKEEKKLYDRRTIIDKMKIEKQHEISDRVRKRFPEIEEETRKFRQLLIEVETGDNKIVKEKALEYVLGK